MKRVLITLVLCLSTFFAYGITPVFASEQNIYIDDWQAMAFQFWFRMGYLPNVDRLANNTTYTLNYNEKLYTDSAVALDIHANDRLVKRISCFTSDYSNITQECFAYPELTGNNITTFDTSYYINDHLYSSTSSSGDGTIIGTNSIDVNYKIPWLKQADNYTNPTSFNQSKAVPIGWRSTIYLIFYSQENLYKSSKPSRYSRLIEDIYVSEGTKEDIIYNATWQNMGGVNYFALSFTNPNPDNCFITINFGDDLSNVMPVYFGNGTNLSNEQKSQFGIDTSTDKLLKELINGTNNSKSIINSSNSVNSAYNTANQQMDALENSVTAEFNSKINNIPTSSSLLSLPKLVSSANWVRQRFNEINIEPFSIMLEFSLILGIALIFLGKIR